MYVNDALIRFKPSLLRFALLREGHGALGAEEARVAFRVPEAYIGAKKCLRRTNSPDNLQAISGRRPGMQTGAG